MAGFADVARLALQPSILALDPAESRAYLTRDLDRQQHRQATQRTVAGQQERHDFDTDLRARKDAAARGGHSLPAAEQRYHPSANPQQYLLDAIMKEQALASYDREAPLAREAMRGARAL